jgi:hypothetical protein
LIGIAAHLRDLAPADAILLQKLPRWIGAVR